MVSMDLDKLNGKAGGNGPNGILVSSVASLSSESKLTGNELVRLDLVSERQKSVSEEVGFQPYGGGEAVAAELSQLPSGDDALDAVQESSLLQEPRELPNQWLGDWLLVFVQDDVSHHHQRAIAAGLIQSASRKLVVRKVAL